MARTVTRTTRKPVKRQSATSVATLRRCLVIDRAIRGRARPTRAGLAELCAVNARTVLRDLKFLREDLQAPLVYDAQSWGWKYSAKWSFRDALLNWLSAGMPAVR